MILPEKNRIKPVAPCYEEDRYRNRKVLLANAGSTVQYPTKVVTSHHKVEFLKVPNNFEGIPFMLQRLYIKYLDCKAQSVEGIFKNPGSRKKDAGKRQFYRRVIKDLLERGWATPCFGGDKEDISLRTYQFVWRDLEIKRFQKRDCSQFKDKSRISSGQFYSYFKIFVDEVADDRHVYFNQIREIIHKKIAERKTAQLRWRLNKGKKRRDVTQATFSAKRAALLFGYRSSSTGSKLRKKNFSIVETNETPGFNPVHGRWEDPCKQIAI